MSDEAADAAVLQCLLCKQSPGDVDKDETSNLGSKF
jgi:hypothetical protein